MKNIIIPWAILLFINIGPAIGQTNINSIRFGSTGDPLNGLTIAWNSQGTTDSIAWGYTAGLENGGSLGVMSTSFIGTRFEYTFPALIAGSTLHYTIFDSKDSVWTETRIFHTASDASDNQFSFTVLGDSRSYPAEWQIISEATLDTDFTLFMGDIVNNGKVASDWIAWFDYGAEFISREPVYHCVGNHDDDNSPSGFDNFLGLYTQPGNELYYSFNYGNALFICLNSESASDSEQYNWLLSTLEANKEQTWKIVFFHKPFYTSPSHSGEMDYYFNTWWKAFDDYGVDLIFNGHTHNYQRTQPINRNVSTTSPAEFYGSGEEDGRCQIVAGNAGAPLSSAADPSLWWLDNSASKRHFCDIQIDGDRLSLRAMDADLVVFDSLRLSKSTAEITFQVDLIEVSDLYDGGEVRLIFGDRDSSFVMTDADADNIFNLTMIVPFDTVLNYFFSYQTGADPGTDFKDETVPVECGDAEGFRELEVPHGNVSLPPVLFGSCEQAPQDITFQVDLGRVSDLYDGGEVWLAFGAWDNYYVMTDPEGDSIYTVTVPVAAGTDLKYFFAYQNGANPDVNFVEEFAPVECGDVEGFRLLKVPHNVLLLPAVMFGSCIEDPGPQPTISIPIINGNDDAEEVLTSLDPGDPQGEMDLTSSDLEIIFDNEPQYVGMLFRNVMIPAGANVSKAYIQFTVDMAYPGTTDIDIDVFIYGAAEATVNAITTMPFSISSHPRTNATVNWSPAHSVAAGDATEAERTPDLSAILTEIISLDGWSPGNNMLIVCTGPTDLTRDINREFESYNGEPSSAPVLNVYFTEPTGVKPKGAEFATSIYPNPSEDNLFIHNPGSGKISFEIYSITGRAVLSNYDSVGEHIQVDVSGLLKGVYIIRLNTEDRSETHKLIIK